jgi:hypothetical protein
MPRPAPVQKRIKNNLRAPARPVIWHDWLRPMTTVLGRRSADQS